ncbi:MAG: RNA polymerase-associated protein RapA [Gammaproteobacteria bacterium]
MPEYKPGQRWISIAELQMGLGTIMRVEQRTVSVMFLATGESRNYAVHTAPLTRLEYAPGDRVRSIDGWEMQVTRVAEQDGLLRYHGVRDDDSQAELPEGLLDCHVQLSRPRERLLSGQLDHDSWFELRYRTQQQLSRRAHSDIRGLIGPRTSLLPHQLYIAHEVAKRHAPRVLLADEVGLGKTIEAGLILHQQLLMERVRRVLILVPESLLHQWLVEMLRRFNLRFSLFDEQRCLDESEGGYDNPYEAEQLVICDLAFLSHNPLRRQQALDSGWDMLVVDEAHHLAWSGGDPGEEYLLVEQLAGATPGVLLLTATPEQLGRQSHFARLRLLDPDRFGSFEEFLEEQAQYRPVAHAVEKLLGDDALDGETLALLHDTLEEGDNRRLVAMLEDETTAGAERQDARERLVDHLLDRHGTGRVLFRNTRASVSGFPGREVLFEALPCPAQYAGPILAGLDPGDAQLLLSPELLYSNMAGEGDAWHLFDPRIAWLLGRLRSLRPEKVLVITSSADTALDIADVLRIRSGIQAAVFHEGMSIVERDRAAAFFADREYGTQVLVCSEIGSEGRNFQFAHHLVLFDLPWNPDLLEQRIGRLDRIGQNATISIHVPYLAQTAQERMVRWCHEGLDAFAKSCPPAHALFSACRDRLFELLSTAPAAQEAFAELIQQTARDNDRLQREMHAGRDRLLEFNSCRPRQAQAICARVAEQEAPMELLDYVERAFDCYGIEQQEHSERCLVVRPGAQMHAASIPGLPEDGMTVTLAREIALANEDMQFLSWEHPMVRGLMEMVATSEQGNSAFTAIRIPRLKPGTLFLECLFLFEGSAGESSGLGAYLPTTMERVVLNAEGREFGDILRHDVIGRARQSIDKSTGPKVIKSRAAQLRAMIENAEAIAAERMPGLIAAAQARAHRLLHVEIERLEALQCINPNVREEEIDFFRQLESRVNAMLDSAHMRLDAVRVLVTL